MTQKEIKKIFITGGAGYVGAMLVPELLSKGYYVTVLDLMMYGEDVIKPNNNLKMVKGDIRDIALLNKEIPEVNCKPGFTPFPIAS